MGLLLIFLLGIANFAMHRAAMESSNAMIRQMVKESAIFGPRMAFALEFVVLLVSMLLVGNGYPQWGWAYVVYTVINGIAAWMILTDRV